MKSRKQRLGPQRLNTGARCQATPILEAVLTRNNSAIPWSGKVTQLRKLMVDHGDVDVGRGLGYAQTPWKLKPAFPTKIRERVTPMLAVSFLPAPYFLPTPVQPALLSLLTLRRCTPWRQEPVPYLASSSCRGRLTGVSNFLPPMTSNSSQQQLS